MEKFASKNPSCVAYDDKLQFYARIMVEVTQQPMIKVLVLWYIDLIAFRRHTAGQNNGKWFADIMNSESKGKTVLVPCAVTVCNARNLSYIIILGRNVHTAEPSAIGYHCERPCTEVDTRVGQIT